MFHEIPSPVFSAGLRRRITDWVGRLSSANPLGANLFNSSLSLQGSLVASSGAVVEGNTVEKYS